MRRIVLTLALAGFVFPAAALSGQQPLIVHAQSTSRTAAGGFAPELERLKGAHTTAWVGYSIPVATSFESGWNGDRVVYLEGDHGGNNYRTGTRGVTHDHAVVLMRIRAGAVDKLRVESVDRQIDAGGLPFVWLTNVDPAQSVSAIEQLARAGDDRQLRDGAVFVISLHRSDNAIPALIALAGPANDLDLREKAAFWLANQRGEEGFRAIQRFAREDADPQFREKLTFDLTLSKEPAAQGELIRMAHEDASPQVRKQAQFWMATKGGPRIVGDLRGAAANDPDLQVRKAAVFALSQLPGDQAAVQLIEVAGSNRDPEVRKQAVFWLGQSNDPRALAYLTKLLETDNSR